MKIQLKSSFRIGMAVALATAIISIGAAQGRRDRDRWDGRVRAFTSNMNGYGTVHVNGRDQQLRQLMVSMGNDRRVTIHVYVNGRGVRDVVFRGQVNDVSRRDGRLTADIDSVDDGYGQDRANADCDITMADKDTFRTVRISGRNTNDRNHLSLEFTSNGRTADDRGKFWDNPGAYGRDRDRDNNDQWRGTGSFVETEEWRRHGEHFVLRYTLTLSRNGDARLVADSIEDRNMPTDDENMRAHGQILKYLQHNHNVVQTGDWRRDGDRITIRFDTVSYGDTRRSKDEKWVGRLRGDQLSITDFEDSFYGHDTKLTFQRN